jgi:hypothetical protein
LSVLTSRGQKPLLRRKSKKTSLSLWRILRWPNVSGWLQSGILGADQAHRWATMLLAHGGVKVSRCQIFRMWLMGSPLHEEAIAEAKE